MSETMRQRWELVRDEHDDTDFGGCLAGCHGSWPCVTRLEAVAALRDLDNAERRGLHGTYSPDHHNTYALVPDPVAAATPPENDVVSPPLHVHYIRGTLGPIEEWPLPVIDDDHPSGT